MKLELLNKDIQDFINSNINSTITSLILKGSPFQNITITELVEQIEAKKRCQKKLPTWFASQNIYYPNKLNIEQTSSETTAKYKANLVSGDSLIDLTGGFGVDCYYFSKLIAKVTHCELNTNLSQLVSHNFKQLNIKNITHIANDGVVALKQIDTPFNWIYIDPSRRDDIKGKVFLLKDCLPNVPKFLNLFFKYANNIMLKTSPLLDITSGIHELQFVKTIHIIAVNNEVKELLWILEKNTKDAIKIKTVNLAKEQATRFNFYLNEETQTTAELSLPLSYLYEPNAAILKAGAFNSIAEKFGLKKIHKHSHLYTSNTLVNFPGRCFKIETILPYNKKQFKKALQINKANVTIRNFPESVNQIRKKLSLKDGGNNYLFFTTDLNNNKIIIATKKAINL